jgi:catechol 2,3-dioxygenase-like lactoylglutathione lyase family enzyme
MKIMDCYPLITVKDMRASRDFYVKHFGLGVIFEASWVTMLGDAENGKIALGLMTPDHPTNPPGPEAFDGKGMIVTIQVRNAAKACAALKAEGIHIFYDLREEPWGQRRFTLHDPSGVIVDVVEQTRPAEGYWEKYMTEPAPALT